MTTGASTQVRVPEVAQRLGVSGKDVYHLIFSGELAGQPNAEGYVVVTEEALAQYLERSSPARGADAPT